MKAIIIVAACLLLAVVLKANEIISNRRPINSVGARANSNSKNIAKIDINDKQSLEDAIARYKYLDD